MTSVARVAVALALCSVGVPTALSAEPPAKPKAKVEFRWLEDKPIRGVTEEKGFRTTCDDALSYAHKSPVLTGADVARARVASNTYINSAGPSEDFRVEFRLTAAAEKKLVAACGDAEGKWLGVFVDGFWSGASWFQKDRSGEFSPPFAACLSFRDRAEWVAASCTPATARTDTRVTRMLLPNDDVHVSYVESDRVFTVELRAKGILVEGVTLYFGNGEVAVELKADPSKGFLFQGKELAHGHVFRKGSTVKVLPGYKRPADLPPGSVYVELPGVTFVVPEKK